MNFETLLKFEFNMEIQIKFYIKTWLVGRIWTAGPSGKWAVCDDEITI
jgi:hypothetical protein